MPVRVRDTSRKTRRERRREEKQNFPVKTAALAASLFAGLSGGVLIAYDDLGKVKPDKMACYPTSEPQGLSVTMVDSSPPHLTVVQARDAKHLSTYEVENELGFNERKMFITTDRANIGSVAKPVLEFCGGARDSAELEDIGAASATKAYLNRERAKLIDQTLTPAFEEIFATDPPAHLRQNVESPVLEQVNAISRISGFQNQVAKRRLTIFSDMQQNTSEAAFCLRKGDMPTFEKFKQGDYYQRIKPASLQGVVVKVYVLERGDLGPYCSGIDELIAFWQGYFNDAGATAEFYTLRSGSYVTSDQ